MPGQAIKKLPVGARSGRWLIHYNDIDACELFLVLSKRLAHDTLDAVSCRRLATVFLGDRKPEPGQTPIVLSVKHRKPFVAAAGGFLEHSAERCGIQ